MVDDKETFPYYELYEMLKNDNGLMRKLQGLMHGKDEVG